MASPRMRTGFLGRMEAVRVLRLHEIEVELAVALGGARGLQLCVRPPASFAALMSAISAISASIARFLRSTVGAAPSPPAPAAHARATCGRSGRRC